MSISKIQALNTHFQPLLMFVIICQTPAQPPKSLQWHHFPTTTFSTCCLSSLSFLCHPVACSLYTISPLLLFCIQLPWKIRIPCKSLPTCFLCSEGTSAYVEWYSVQLRSAGDLPLDWKIWTTRLQLFFFFRATLASVEAGLGHRGFLPSQSPFFNLSLIPESSPLQRWQHWCHT